MRTIATLLIALAGFTLQTDEAILGYGEWRFGMTPDEVRAVASASPYTPVATTGGLETAGGSFRGRQTNVSFIFGPRGLQVIQVWAYEGKDFDDALAALHDVYEVLSEKVGRLQLGGQILEKDLSVAALTERLPPEMGASDPTIPEAELTTSGSFSVHPINLRLEPIIPRPGPQMFAVFQKVPELGLYLVMLLHRAAPQ